MPTSQALEKYDWMADYWWQAVSVDTDKYTSNVELNQHDGYFIRALPGYKTVFPVQACLYLAKARAIQNVHNLSLIKDIQERGQGEVGVENYATIFHNNAFAVHRFHVPGLDYDGRIFPRVTDQGTLGEIIIDNEPVKVGGNEEIALMLQALSQGVELPTRLLAGRQTLIRDPQKEITSVDKKVARRPQVARKYQEHYRISDERLLKSLRKNFQVVFDV